MFIVRVIVGILASLVLSVSASSAQAKEDITYTPIEKNLDSCHCPCEPDYEISKMLRYEITAKGGKYNLKAEINETVKFLSQRSTRDDIHRISEPSYLNFKSFNVTFRGEKLGKGRVYKFNDKSDDTFFSEEKERVFKLPGNIKAGDVLSVNYKSEYGDIAFFPVIHIPNTDYISEFTIVIVHPEGVKITPEIFFPKEELTYTFFENSIKETILRFRNICRSKELPYFLYNDIRAAILISITKDDKPITPTTPSAFVEWYASKTSLAPKFSNSIREQLSFRPTSENEIEKISEINDYVRQNVRYIADIRPAHAFVPYSPDTVLSRKYGDCKDRASLVTALAGESNLESPMVVVSAFPDRAFSGVHPTFFNHVISTCVSGGDTLFFDPTARYYSFQNFPDYLTDKFGIIMKESISSPIVHFPADDSPLVRIDISGNLDSLESSTALISFMGGWQGLVEGAVTELNDHLLQYFLDSLTATKLYRISFGKFELVDRSASSLTFSAPADLRKFVIAGEKTHYFPIVPFVAVDRALVGRKDDSCAIHFTETDRVRLIIKLNSPNMDFNPEVIEMGDPDNAYFRAELARVDSTEIMLSYFFDRSKKSFGRETRHEFIAFCKSFLGKKADAFILKEKYQ
jgi:hypothetical protein